MTPPLHLQTKRFRADFPTERGNDDTTDHDVVVQEESLDIHEANTAIWQASEELTAFIGITRKPISKFDHRQIVKDYPRPNVDTMFTPRLDSYLPGLMGGLTGPDSEFKEVQDKIADVYRIILSIQDLRSLV